MEKKNFYCKIKTVKKLGFPVKIPAWESSRKFREENIKDLRRQPAISKKKNRHECKNKLKFLQPRQRSIYFFK